MLYMVALFTHFLSALILSAYLGWAGAIFVCVTFFSLGILLPWIFQWFGVVGVVVTLILFWTLALYCTYIAFVVMGWWFIPYSIAAFSLTFVLRDEIPERIQA